MSRILWVAFSYMTAQPWIESLASLNEHDIEICWYDRHTPCDQAILDHADRFRPEVVLYTGMADYVRTPSFDTFRRLRHNARVIHISGDLSDPPYIPYLNEYAVQDCFDLSVNIDGNADWPQHGPSLTLLSPTAPSFYAGQAPVNLRSIDLGFCGGHASPSRWAILSHLVTHAGLQILPRIERYGTYSRFADFMTSCRMVVNVPFSGSDAVRQVKGRVLESGLAGCVLLDHVESMAQKWFIPGTDYAVYESKDHAVEVVKGLLADRTEMLRLAAHLQHRVTNEHGPKQFWGKVLA